MLRSLALALLMSVCGIHCADDVDDKYPLDAQLKVLAQDVNSQFSIGNDTPPAKLTKLVRG
jgi:hypothetical protein